MNFRKPLVSLATVFAAAALVAGCADQPLGGGYYGNNGGYSTSQGGYGIQNSNYSRYGRVTNVQYVRGGNSGGVVGTVAGGAAGGLLGHQVGKGSGRTAATIAGAVGGALIGSAIERNTAVGGQPVYRVTVQFDDGSRQDFNYADAPNVQIGDRVRAEGNQLYR